MTTPAPAPTPTPASGIHRVAERASGIGGAHPSVQRRPLAARRWAAGAGLAIALTGVVLLALSPRPLWTMLANVESTSEPNADESFDVPIALGAIPDGPAELVNDPAEAAEIGPGTPEVELASYERPAAEETRAGSDDTGRSFNGRPVRPVKVMRMTVTAYSPDARSCGKFADNITASGYSVWTNAGRLVAADTDLLPFGTLVSVPGYDGGAIVPVLDRGGAIKDHRLDVLYPTHEIARQWGRQDLLITIWEYADGEPDDFEPIF